MFAQPALISAIKPVEVVGIKDDSGFVAIAPLDHKRRVKHPEPLAARYFGASLQCCQFAYNEIISLLCKKMLHYTESIAQCVKTQIEQGKERHAAQSHRR